MSAGPAPLWEPLAVGPATLPNRVFVSAHQTGYAAEAGGLVGERYVAYLAERARGGAGLLVTEVAAIHRSPRRLSAGRPEIVAGWRRLGEAVREHGSRLFVQLWHPGAHEVADADLDDPRAALAPSAEPSVFTGRTPRAMDAEDIRSTIAAYARAAALAREGGVDGIELHAGHGYLPCQFLSPLTNRRTDGYGGSTANRCRFVLELAEAVRAACGPGLALGVRLSFDEFVGDAGLTPDESERIVAELHGAGVLDFFDVSGGNYHSMHRMIPPAVAGLDGHLASHAARAKAVVGDGAAVFVASGVRTVARAAAIVAAGQADAVGMTRAHLADPALVAKARAGRADEIRLCVGANQGCLRRLYRHGTITCTANPAAGRERRLGAATLGRAARRQRVVVVGGGPAGLQAAETAARRGHEVVLLEREAELGGQLLVAGRLPRRDGWLELARSLAASVRRLGVDVRVGVAADVATVAALSPDRVVVATGSRFVCDGRSLAAPQAGPLAGLASLAARDVAGSIDATAGGAAAARSGDATAGGAAAARSGDATAGGAAAAGSLDAGDAAGAATGALDVLDPAQAVADPERCGARVVIADDVGDHLPLGLALLLAQRGRAVEVVSRTAFAGAGAGLDQTGDLPWLLPALAGAGVRVTAQALVTRARPGGVDVRPAWGGSPRAVAADTLVLNARRLADDGLADELLAAGLDPVRIGDCLAPREVDDAMAEGMRCGAEL